MKALSRSLGAVAFLASAHAFAAESVSSPPYEMMRALSILQDQIAAGNAIAQVGQVKMIARMAERFSTIDPSVWKDKRNARALVLYLFGGGDAAAIEGTVDKEQIAKGYETLFEGALAYALGSDQKARTVLLPLDPRTLPSGLGGHLALVQATLIANEDKAKALQKLDLARLLEPGTLVEEAALRKGMFLIGATGDLDKFALLARRYTHAFSKSIYAENFRQLEVKTAVEISKGNNAESDIRLDALLNGVEKQERRMIYLNVARSAVLDGRSVTARHAGSMASKLSDKPDTEDARAKVYFGAATIVGDDYDLGVSTLMAVDPVRLNKRDAALRESALEIATMIRSRDSGLDGMDDPENVVDAGGVQKTIGDAERALSTSDALLKRSVP